LLFCGATRAEIAKKRGGGGGRGGGAPGRKRFRCVPSARALANLTNRNAIGGIRSALKMPPHL
jgi:hypothetical protein